MNEAHLHLVVNHFPIIATILGFGILAAGVFRKNKIIMNTAYSVFIVAAIFSAVSMATGDGAEEMVENMPSIGKHIIHEHEEMAEKLALLLYVLGTISIVGIVFNNKDHKNQNIVAYLALFLATCGIVLGALTGTTGGEIRHTEIRSNQLQNIEYKANDVEKTRDKD